MTVDYKQTLDKLLEEGDSMRLYHFANGALITIDRLENDLAEVSAANLTNARYANKVSNKLRDLQRDVESLKAENKKLRDELDNPFEEIDLTVEEE